MSEHAITNLTSLSPLEEFLARVAISSPGEDRLKLGLPAVVGAPDGRAYVIEPKAPGTQAGAAPAQEPEPF